MGSYSGDDVTTVFLDVFVSKLPNSILSSFEEKDKKNLVEVWIKDNTIDKFYFHDLDMDLKDLVDEKTTIFFNEFYFNNDNDNLLQEVELNISYYVRGYYDPGVTYGPPENCYPEEWNEERTVTAAELVLDNKKQVAVNIPSQYFDKIYDAFQKNIEEEEFNPPDEGDYDYEGEEDDYERDYDYD